MDVQLRLANGLSEQRRFEEARYIYNDCLNQFGSEFIIIANLALLEMDCENNSTAIAHFERALSMDTTWFEGWYNLGNMYMEMGPESESDAISCYEKCLVINPSDSDTYNNLAVCLMKSGQLDKAVDCAKMALRLDKDNSLLQINLAELYNQLGDNKKALFFGLKAACKNDPTALMLVATIHKNLHDDEKAESCLKSVCDTCGLHLPAAIRYYSLLVQNGRPSEANQVLLTLIPKYKDAYPDDLLGLYVLEHMTGRSTEGPKEQNKLSVLLENLLLHLSVNNAEQLAHKCLAAEHFAHVTSLKRFLPETHICCSRDDVLDVLDVKTKGLWYLKDPAIQRGQGITIIKTPLDSSVPKFSFSGRMCLQKGIPPLLLEDGRKFGIRMHVFLKFCGPLIQVFMCDDGILTKCANKFSSDETSLQTHITCTSVQRSIPGFNRATVKGPASKLWPDFVSTLPLFIECILATVEAVKFEVRCCPESLFSGQLFGYDFIISEDGTPIFLEANISPQFQDSKNMESLLETVAKPLINGFAQVIISPCQLENSWREIGCVQSREC